MKITTKMIKNLLMLMNSHGLVHGAGHQKTQFCVQQAVNRVLHNDLYGQYGDNPTDDCLDGYVRGFGVRMNDCLGTDITVDERAMALKRFAVAELGSNLIDHTVFFSKLADRLGVNRSGDITGNFMAGSENKKREERVAMLKTLADTAADVLQEMGTEGSKFLHLIEETDEDKKIKETCKLGRQIYAAQMATFGTTSCAVKQQHKQGGK